MKKSGMLNGVIAVMAVMLTTSLPALARVHPPVNLPDVGSTTALAAIGLISVGALMRMFRRQR
jgi:hypothetical protein